MLCNRICLLSTEWVQTVDIIILYQYQAIIRSTLTILLLNDINYLFENCEKLFFIITLNSWIFADSLSHYDSEDFSDFYNSTMVSSIFLLVKILSINLYRSISTSPSDTILNNQDKSWKKFQVKNKYSSLFFNKTIWHIINIKLFQHDYPIIYKYRPISTSSFQQIDTNNAI